MIENLLIMPSILFPFLNSPLETPCLVAWPPLCSPLLPLRRRPLVCLWLMQRPVRNQCWREGRKSSKTNITCPSFNVTLLLWQFQQLSLHFNCKTGSKTASNTVRKTGYCDDYAITQHCNDSWVRKSRKCLNNLVSDIVIHSIRNRLKCRQYKCT